MKLIPLSRGLFAKVDDADYPALALHNWTAGGAPGRLYAYRNERSGTGYRRVYMHRQILDAQKGEIVDHKSGDGLDNQRENIRRCTTSDNMRNRKPSSACGFLGVTWSKGDKRWVAQCSTSGKNKRIGAFLTAEEAARAYDQYAKDNFPDFARPNFP